MKTIDKVLKLLNEDSRTRDNDELLTALIWYKECQGDSSDFLKRYAQREFTSAESIRRCRQKLQEEFPGLRGKTYTIRHKTNHKQLFQ
jgi:hypothetical protein